MNQNIELGSVSVVNEYADKVHDVSSGTEVVNVDSVLVSMNGGEVKQNRVSHPLRATKELKEMHKEMDEAEEIQLAMALSASMSASTGNQDQQGDHGGEPGPAGRRRLRLPGAQRAEGRGRMGAQDRVQRGGRGLPAVAREPIQPSALKRSEMSAPTNHSVRSWVK